MLRTLALLTLLALPGPALAGPGTLAILYFDNQGNPELEPLKVGLSQMLITDLRGTEGVTVVERAQLQAILDELELGHSGVADPDTAAQVGKLLGAEWMLLGSYFELMGTLRIDARLVRVETGEIVHAFGVNDASQAFMQMEKSIAGSFRTALTDQVGASTAAGDGPTGFADAGADPDDGGDAAADASATTRGGGGDTAAAGDGSVEVARPDAQALDAAVAFSEGLIYLDRSDVPRAREAFQQALATDPNLDAAQEALASLDI